MPPAEQSAEAPRGRRGWRRPDPLVWLLLVGAALYVIERLVTGEALIPVDTDAERVLVISADMLDERRAVLARQLGREPSEHEFHSAMKSWLDDEILANEARLQGLDREDAVIRMRLARRMVEVFEHREAPPEVSDEALRAWHDMQPERWHALARVTLRQLYVPGSDMAAQEAADDLLRQLQAGADPRELARTTAPPPGGPVLRGRTPDRLSELFGEAFVHALEDLDLETWKVVPSPSGFHVVQVTEREPGGALPWAQVRDRVQAAWETEAVRSAARDALESLRKEWTFVGWPP